MMCATATPTYDSAQPTPIAMVRDTLTFLRSNIMFFRRLRLKIPPLADRQGPSFLSVAYLERWTLSTKNFGMPNYFLDIGNFQPYDKLESLDLLCPD